MRTFVKHPDQDAVAEIVEQLGKNLRTARVRRKMTQALAAERINVSLPTYRSMEAGKATASIGHYISAFSVMGLADFFLRVGAPEEDLVGLAVSRRSGAVDNNF